ncbi:hypothetical protein BU25DRAFT_266364 [Macroventuria anomochaeta]|uniref:Uncharacterized protein n=1 Tax=Macroventuria anomochaeta TaxID=301207 RepID=A0ACB6S7W3_9PLEO|nr:uncharacterized protein BU25DRAFT_266364 [Macroventuria anomochaeta]KAF2630154.1 hypothetical protein BU25DRAFT_266364 [Macroventuria anomochaeta]
MTTKLPSSSSLRIAVTRHETHLVEQTPSEDSTFSEPLAHDLGVFHLDQPSRKECSRFSSVRLAPHDMTDTYSLLAMLQCYRRQSSLARVQTATRRVYISLFQILRYTLNITAPQVMTPVTLDHCAQCAVKFSSEPTRLANEVDIYDYKWWLTAGSPLTDLVNAKLHDMWLFLLALTTHVDASVLSIRTNPRCLRCARLVLNH